MPQYVRKSAFAAPYIEIIERLIARRKELGLSQVELAERFGTKQDVVSAIERRQRRLDVWEFVRMCRILDVEYADILHGVEPSR